MTRVLLVAIISTQFLTEKPILDGFLAGLSTLAMVAAINDTNGGLYMALIGQYGKPEDAGAYTVMSLESGPFFTMLTLGVAGLAGFPWPIMLGAILPLVVGMLLGNLDPQMKEFLGRAVPVMIPFFAFSLGASIKLEGIWQTGLLWILIGIGVVLISGTILFIVDRLTGGNGIAGLAATSTAGNAAAVPSLVAAANPLYADAAKSATLLVSTSVVVTIILVPLITAAWANIIKPRKSEQS